MSAYGCKADIVRMTLRVTKATGQMRQAVQNLIQAQSGSGPDQEGDFLCSRSRNYR
jgi:hypothetical protein